MISYLVGTIVAVIMALFMWGATDKIMVYVKGKIGEITAEHVLFFLIFVALMRIVANLLTMFKKWLADED